MINGEASLEVSLLIPVRDPGPSLLSSIQILNQFLTRSYGERYEILVIPNDRPQDYANTFEITQKLLGDFSENSRIRILSFSDHPPQAGKGAALKVGAAHARGKWIFFTDADLPYDLSFFERALPLLRRGFDLVSGNRRLPESLFNLPAFLIPLALARHRLGKRFNWAVRLLFPISATDTQAGIKAMSRSFAQFAFEKVKCPGFFLISNYF